MWICLECENENEENFKFCWNCGKTKAATEFFAPPPQAVEREIVAEQPPETEKKASIADDTDILPILSHIAGVEKEVPPTDQEISLERKVFTIVVRLLGLFLLYQVFVALPDLLWAIYSRILEGGRTTDRPLAMVVGTLLSLPVAKLLLYLIVGIYLIASGRILLWMLPRR